MLKSKEILKLFYKQSQNLVKIPHFSFWGDAGDKKSKKIF